jgi:hypothetical protein
MLLIVALVGVLMGWRVALKQVNQADRARLLPLLELQLNSEKNHLRSLEELGSSDPFVDWDIKQLKESIQRMEAQIQELK